MATFEICNNTEWLREHGGLNLDAIPDGEENAAADELRREIVRRLGQLGRFRRAVVPPSGSLTEAIVTRKAKPVPVSRCLVSDSALRALLTVRHLQKRRWRSVRHLADRYGVDEKTIRRDLAVIRRAGFPLKFVSEDFNRRVYRIDRE